MNTHYLTRARLLFCSEFVSRETNRHNQLQWARQIRQLGSKWLLFKPMELKT
jgi:hypothetical protein